MAEQAEKAFARTFLNTLSSQPITYADDYQQPSQYSLKRVPVLPIAVPPPPERKPLLEASGSSSASISLVFKSLKPPASYTLLVEPTDTIAAIKAQLAAQPTAPPADVQRLLLKGKALADGKLLKEYTIKAGDTVNLMVKPGHHWDPTATTTTATADHQRIPSVVLSPSPSSDSPGSVEKDIMLTLDAGVLPSPVTQPETMSTYHEVVANPEFWERLHAFLKCARIQDRCRYLSGIRDFLRAAKGSLTASEIAKIRDTVGVVGMAGT
ncbi:hypothetical protein BDZ97DRAFT_2021663 [Flammula alnicola]|nr:hypothetical protein BDZ97DRAFT_2021663 [Flammula alnicola]